MGECLPDAVRSIRTAFLVVSLTIVAVSELASAAPLARFAGSDVVVESQPGGERFELYRAYRRRFGPWLNPDGAIRRVFNPLGASDLGTTLTLFAGPGGGPREVAIADLFPFGRPLEIEGRHGMPGARDAYFAGKARGWLHYEPLWKQVRVAGAGILWELEQLGARDVRIEYLDERGRPRRPDPGDERSWGVADAHAAMPRERRRVGQGQREVARVRFVLGGVERSLLYVQHDLGGEVPAVLRDFFARGLDAIVEKATMRRDGLPLAAYDALVAQAMRHLDRRHGLVLSDEKAADGADRRPPRGFHSTFAPATFGYFDAVRIWSRRPMGRPPGGPRPRAREVVTARRWLAAIERGLVDSGWAADPRLRQAIALAEATIADGEPSGRRASDAVASLVAWRGGVATSLEVRSYWDGGARVAALRQRTAAGVQTLLVHGAPVKRIGNDRRRLPPGRPAEISWWGLGGDALRARRSGSAWIVHEKDGEGEPRARVRLPDGDLPLSLDEASALDRGRRREIAGPTLAALRARGHTLRDARHARRGAISRLPTRRQ